MPRGNESLAEACTPLLLFLTAFRRNASQSTFSLESLSKSLQREIDEVQRRCDADRELSKLFDKAYYPLIVAADQVVLSSDWPQRVGWRMRLLETHYFKTAEGGKRFFELVDDVLEDSSEDAPPLAAVLFQCMALGFQGEFLGMPRELEKRRRRLFEKARLAGGLGETLTPAAYGRNVEQRVHKLPTVGVARVLFAGAAALLFGLALAAIVTRVRNDQTLGQVKTVTSGLRSTLPPTGDSAPRAVPR